jgi:hypothetical protein
MAWEKVNGINYVTTDCACGHTQTKAFKSNTEYGVVRGKCDRCDLPLTFVYG